MANQANQNRRRLLTPGQRVCLLYLVLAAGWIFLTDGLAPPNPPPVFHMIKGIFFVICTTALLYLLLRRYTRLVELRTRQLDLACGEEMLGIAQVDSQGRVQEANDFFLHLCGFSRGEMEAGALNWHSLTPPEFGVTDDKAFWQARQQGESDGYRREIVRRSGERIPVLIRLAVLLPGTEQLTAYVQDLSIMQRVEEETRRLARIVELTEQPIISYSLEGTVLSWNHGAEVLYGYTAGEAIGQSGKMLLAGGDGYEWERVFAALNSGERCRLECQCRTKAGEDKSVLLILYADLDSKGRRIGAVSFSLDLADTKRAKLMEAQFQQAQKLESLGRLAGGIAHDFNNLLMVITSYVQLLCEDQGTTAKQRQSLDEILTAADRATALTRQLLAFSRKQAMKMEALSLNRVIEETSRMLERVIGEDVRLRLQLGEGLWPVESDISHLTQVLMNLSVNARDAMPQGGELTISTANVTISEETTKVYTLPAGDYVCLKVKDSGTGMNELTRTHLFEPFFTTKEKGRGTGLGLSMVYGVVQQCGGQIRVESSPGAGTTFLVYLPRTLKSSAQAGSEEPFVKVTGMETLLVVEDEYSLRSSIAQYMERHGYQILTAANGAEALNLVHARKALPDLLLTDLGMPGMNGRQLWAQLQQEMGVLPVIFMTGYADQSLLADEKSHLVAYLDKPFALEALSRAVRELLERARPKATGSDSATGGDGQPVPVAFLPDGKRPAL
jgi:PAS domain S-box-containing protein